MTNGLLCYPIIQLFFSQTLNKNKMKAFPNFWYESNAIWGQVDSMDKLCTICSYILKGPNAIDTPDDFLDKSR